MHISAPDKIEKVAWEGELLAPEGMKAGSGSARPIVTLGVPEVWTAAEAFENQTGTKWSTPLGDAQYWLVRLAITLHPMKGRDVISEVNQSLYISPSPLSAGAASAYARDLFPLSVGVESKSSFTISLSPELNLVDCASIKLGEVGVSYECPRVFPAIQAFGAGEAEAYWEFKAHPAHPLLGTQYVYAVLAARPPARGLGGSVTVRVTTQTVYGPLRFGTSEAARLSTTFNLP